MSKTQVELKIEGAHAAITFITDEGLNVLNSEVLHSFHAIVARIGGEPRIRTAVIHGTGKVFLAGADIKEMAKFTPAQGRAYAELGQGVFADLAALPCVTVAAINGPALGGGLELALACDFRFAVKSAKLGCPEVTLGLIPGWGGVGRLTKLIGQSRAKRLYLSGTPHSAEETLPWGLVDEVVNSAEDLEHRVAAFC
ncbi:MAG: enoyl-CoA hydratase/isomerase family protein, partial [Planctomycetes bacterium]|nr:enoyl-CoA hydratase/isomerase family protein [Planctomycetota bacterium]